MFVAVEKIIDLRTGMYHKGSEEKCGENGLNLS